MQSSFLYVRIEAISLIYEVIDGTNVKYAYTPYLLGDPHSISNETINILSEHKSVVAYVHTHIYGETFSWEDETVAIRRNWIAYVANPQRKLKRFAAEGENAYEHPTVKERIRYISLSKEEQNALVNEYQQIWEQHKNSCEYNNKNADCSTASWPQQPPFYWGWFNGLL